ncbi:AMP-dependent synthetase/ligase [Bifidobacterium mongoliense]|uniref:AMP-dependent synthetase/ligase n=1 Tax=Bifidobacterium mongoliense TaxID=518643 RepID=UPI002A758AEB|nr:AMP-dependent synthetase/ligase [Bifidobacterium mongoliense]MDY3126482.1 AMP-dependent synthetase/ligase [Bifidobacterium mongoliense]
MLTEYTTPGAPVVNDDESLYALLTERIRRSGEDTVIAASRTKEGTWRDVTTGEFHTAVLSASKGLMALGIARGDAVTIFSSTRYEWGVLDLALAAVGAVSVPIYDTDSAAQAERIINDAQVKLVFVDDRERYNRVAGIADHCPSLTRTLMFDANALGVLEGLGVAVSDGDLTERIGAGRADDLATIVYTSGSTGAPKGVELTHRNFLSVVRAGFDCLPEMICDDHPRLLLFLPLAHCFARYIQYCSIGTDDGVVGYLPDTSNLLPDIRRFRPTYLLGVPRVFEKVYNAASHRAGTGAKGRLFAKAVEASRAWSRMMEKGVRPNLKQQAEHIAYDASVYRAVRSALGPNIRYIACGGAPLSDDLAHFFSGIGLRMIQGYGLTETAAPFTVTRAAEMTIGTVGQPAPGGSVRIAPDSEIQLKGPNVFVGYHNRPEDTKEAFTDDGWFATGDLGALDDEGRLRITGRKKDIIITAGGKNVSPIPAEQAIAACPIVEHAVVVGDGRPFVGALVTLDDEALAQWLPTQRLAADLSSDEAAALPEVHEFIQRFVDKANASVSRAESVRKFVVLPGHLTQRNGCLTPSLKVVRPRVTKVFADEIDQKLYGGKR